MSRSIKFAALAVTGGVAVASLVLPSVGSSSAATPPPTTIATTNKAAAAAGYLISQFVGKNKDHYTGSYVSSGKTVTYVNYGETADAILSIDASGYGQTAAARATKYLETNVGDYAGTDDSDYNPGPIGKLLLVAEAQHVSVTNFGGANLVSELAATEGARGAAPGEFQQNAKGTDPSYDYFSTVSQALAVLGLEDSPHAGNQPSAAAVNFLADQQCNDGDYPSELLSDVTTACAAGGDVDSTAYAAQALIAAGDHDAALRALKWLTTQRNKDGGFGAGGSNANSTAIAVEALIDGHVDANAAVAWLAKHQVGCSAPASERGAIAYQTTYDGSALLATSQAGAALARTPLAWIDRGDNVHGTPSLSCPKKK